MTRLRSAVALALVATTSACSSLGSSETRSVIGAAEACLPVVDDRNGFVAFGGSEFESTPTLVDYSLEGKASMVLDVGFVPFAQIVPGSVISSSATRLADATDNLEYGVPTEGGFSLALLFDRSEPAVVAVRQVEFEVDGQRYSDDSEFVMVVSDDCGGY